MHVELGNIAPSGANISVQLSQFLSDGCRWLVGIKVAFLDDLLSNRFPEVSPLTLY